MAISAEAPVLATFAGVPDEDRPIVRELRQRVRQELARLDDDKQTVDDPRIRQVIREQIESHQRRAFSTTNTPRLVDAAAAERALIADFLGRGPLEPYLEDPRIEEVGVVGPGQDWAWGTDGTKRRIQEVLFDDEGELISFTRRLLAPLNRRLDAQSPMVDAALPDGSRLHAVLGFAFGGVSRVGTSLTIRKFPERFREMADLVDPDTLDWPSAQFLLASVAAYCNIVVSGGFGTGKTTFANVLLCSISGTGRVVLVEDTHELSAVDSIPDGIALESRPPNAEGAGEITQRDLIKTALRMRPERICVGEVRGPEALEMIHAMNSGQAGSMTTVHASTPREAVDKLGMHLRAAEPNASDTLIAHWISQSVHVLVQLAYHKPSGRRYVASIAQVAGREGPVVQLEDLWTRDSARAPLVRTGVQSRLHERFRLEEVNYTLPSAGQVLP